MAEPALLLLDPADLGPATDFYQLTMAAGYIETGMTHPATFELSVREMPANRGYLVAAGLEQALAYLSNVRFAKPTIDHLRSLPAFARASGKFFDFLAGFKFTGDVHAMPEGTVFFPNEPVLRVTAPLPEAQIVETYLLATIHFQSLIATKAARLVEAAQGRGIVDLGSRRAHGPQAGVWAARAACIGGFIGTSNLLAAQSLGIAPFGAMAHSWVMAHTAEQDAFLSFAKLFPDHSILVLDTTNTREAARKVARLGQAIVGVRLDSGNLAELAREARALLDEAGLKDAIVVASGDLNEQKIHDLVRKGAPIEVFAVGTEVATSRDAPALGVVYKLTEVEKGGIDVPRVKTSEGKSTLPGKKQVFRKVSPAGRLVEDVIAAVGENFEGWPLLEPVMRQGKVVKDPEPLDKLRARAELQRTSLDPAVRRFERPDPYPVRVSDRLTQLAEQAAWGARR